MAFTALNWNIDRLPHSSPTFKQVGTQDLHSLVVDCLLRLSYYSDRRTKWSVGRHCHG
jgi:hypothetical protein